MIKMGQAFSKRSMFINFDQSKNRALNYVMLNDDLIKNDKKDMKVFEFTTLLEVEK